MGFTIFALIFLAIGLTHDFKRDKGKHAKAKVLQTICLTILIASYAGSFKILGMLIRDFDRARQHFSVAFGPVSADVSWMMYLIQSAVVLTVLILAYQMIRRSDKSRSILVKLLPVAGLLEVFSFYRGWVIGGDDLGLNHGVIILIGCVIVGSITAFIFFVYQSKLMTDFFAVPEQSANTPNPEANSTQRQGD